MPAHTYDDVNIAFDEPGVSFDGFDAKVAGESDLRTLDRELTLILENGKIERTEKLTKIVFNIVLRSHVKPGYTLIQNSL